MVCYVTGIVGAHSEKFDSSQTKKSILETEQEGGDVLPPVSFLAHDQ